MSCVRCHAEEQEREIRRKIFSRIRGKLEKNPRKGPDGSRHLNAKASTLTPEERATLESPHEIGLIYGASGRLQKAILGGKSKVDMPLLKKGQTASHNHPGGLGPSDSDLSFALQSTGGSLRITAPTPGGKVELYEIAVPSMVDPGLRGEILGRYISLTTKGGDTAASKKNALVLILEEFSGILMVSVLNVL